MTKDCSCDSTFAGPCRGIDFHNTQPLFVSGGDDYKIKVWNYKLRRCIFTLIGHLDYIRTVYFHHESPWIVSASDDQTVRIWNWQNRSCLAVLTGHSHYCMSAMFSPNEDLVVSASLDQTIRVWDISSLREKAVRPSDVMSQVRGQLPAAVNADLFGGTDAIVKYVLEGHSRGVNWAAFHPTLPLIVSGADDRQIKLWRMTDTKAWEIDTFRGHLNNVSCVMFHPRKELVISDSEDRTIRVWDLNRRTCLQTFRRENDRFWIMAAHPSVNLLAAGHDSGMIVFKLERERPAYEATENSLIYKKDRFLRVLDYNMGRDNPLVAVRQASPSFFDGAGGGGFGGPASSMYYGGGGGGPSHQPPPRSMSYNAAEHAVLLNYDTDGGTYELYTNLPKGGSAGDTLMEPRKGSGVSAVFVGRNRFATLDKGKSINVLDLRNEITKRVPIKLPGADMLFGAGNGFVLLKSAEKVVLMDLQQRKITAEIPASHVRYVCWSDDRKRVALLGKHVIVLATRRLEHLATVHETIRVKSAAWDASGVLLYTTLNHLKYCIPNGDNGIVSTLSRPLYLTRVRGPGVCYLDRECNPGILAIDPTEYTFKLLLLRKRYDDVKRMIAENRLQGQAIIAYLQAKGFPEVALRFVRDEKTRLSLALDSGNVEVALQAAEALDDTNAFKALANVAMSQGDLDTVELCYQRTKDLEKLAFLYVIMGEFEKLSKLMKLAEVRGNVAARFQIAMYLGDVPARVQTLRDCGQGKIATLTAVNHGLLTPEEAQDVDVESMRNKNGKLMMPPVPVGPSGVWPQLPIARGMFSRDPNAEAFEEPEIGAGGDYYEDAAAFEESERDTYAEKDDEREAANVVDPFAVGLDTVADGGGDGGWGDDIDNFDIKEDIGDEATNGGLPESGENDEFGNGGNDEEYSEYYVPPTAGPGFAVRWSSNASLAGELVAAGNFEAAMKLLQEQIGLKDCTRMKEAFLDIYSGCRAVLHGGTNMQANLVGLSCVGSNREKPMVAGGLPMIGAKFAIGRKHFANAKFSEASKEFESILLIIPLLVVDGSEVEDVKKVLRMCREYVIGLKIEKLQRDAKSEGQVERMIQLAGLFTKCEMTKPHKLLTLRVAMKAAYDTKNFQTAGRFARRLLEMNPGETMQKKARTVIAMCDRNNTDANEIEFDDRRSFEIECGELKPIYANSDGIKCSYCEATYEASKTDYVCNICRVGTIGKRGEGLRVAVNQFR